MTGKMIFVVQVYRFKVNIAIIYHAQVAVWCSGISSASAEAMDTAEALRYFANLQVAFFTSNMPPAVVTTMSKVSKLSTTKAKGGKGKGEGTGPRYDSSIAQPHFPMLSARERAGVRRYCYRGADLSPGTSCHLYY